MKVGKKRKEAEAKYDNTKSYTLLEASNILKQISSTKFDASVDIDVRLGVVWVRWFVRWYFVHLIKNRKLATRVLIT
jgi:hypothetical protein